MAGRLERFAGKIKDTEVRTPVAPHEDRLTHFIISFQVALLPYIKMPVR